MYATKIELVTIYQRQIVIDSPRPRIKLVSATGLDVDPTFLRGWLHATYSMPFRRLC